jgi:hypothetical protein
MEGVRATPALERVDGPQSGERKSARLVALDRVRGADEALERMPARLLRRVLVDG